MKLFSYFLLSTAVAMEPRHHLRKHRGGRKSFRNLYNYTDITCTGDNLIPCNGDGLFVCRQYPSRRDPEILLSKDICIPSNMSYAELDTCGCCGEECPEECPAETCTCTIGRNNKEREGIQLLVDGEEDPICVSRRMARKMLGADEADELSCNTDCSV